MAELMQMKLAERVECIAEGMCPTFAPMANVTQCINGKAGVYSCKNMGAFLSSCFLLFL
jgi:hypothetical protein